MITAVTLEGEIHLLFLIISGINFTSGKVRPFGGFMRAVLMGCSYPALRGPPRLRRLHPRIPVSHPSLPPAASQDGWAQQQISQRVNIFCSPGPHSSPVILRVNKELHFFGLLNKFFCPSFPWVALGAGNCPHMQKATDYSSRSLFLPTAPFPFL